jgi:hypothetical protein
LTSISLIQLVINQVLLLTGLILVIFVWLMMYYIIVDINTILIRYVNGVLLWHNHFRLKGLHVRSHQAFITTITVAFTWGYWCRFQKRWHTAQLFGTIVSVCQHCFHVKDAFTNPILILFRIKSILDKHISYSKIYFIIFNVNSQVQRS